jgi:hypothetical protein
MRLAQLSGKMGQALPMQTRFTAPRFDKTGASEPAHLMHDRSRVHIEAGEPSSKASV